jgi:TldD protein
VTGQPTSDDLFYSGSDLTSDRAVALTEDALANADDGELFLEYRQSENLVFDDGQLRTASFRRSPRLRLARDQRRSIGLRPFGRHFRSRHQAGGRDGARGAARLGRRQRRPGAYQRTSLYAPDNPVEQMSFEDKVALLREVDSLHPRARRARQSR